MREKEILWHCIVNLEKERRENYPHFSCAFDIGSHLQLPPSLSLSLSVSFAHPYAITHTRYFLTYIIASLLFFLYYNCVSDNGTKDRHFFDSHIFSLSQVLNYLSACLHGFYLSPLISPFHISIFILSLCYFLLLILELFLPSVQHSLASIFQC